MCYRQGKVGVWAKPVGTHLFTYEEDRQEWTNWFTNQVGERDRWEHKNYNEDTDGPFLDWLSQVEAWTPRLFAGTTILHLSPEPQYWVDW